jgi:hypothetical protein
MLGYARRKPGEEDSVSGSRHTAAANHSKTTKPINLGQKGCCHALKNGLAVRNHPQRSRTERYSRPGNTTYQCRAQPSYDGSLRKLRWIIPQGSRTIASSTNAPPFGSLRQNQRGRAGAANWRSSGCSGRRRAIATCKAHPCEVRTKKPRVQRLGVLK